jgi:dTMP kinase
MSLVGIEGNEEMRVIDAGRSAEDVAQDIVAGAMLTIDNIGSKGPLRRLGALEFLDIEL